MSVRVNIDGRVSGPEDATVSVFDRGFLYGDSVYEVMRTAGGHPVDEARHLERLRRSAAAIGLLCPADEVLRAETRATLDAAGNAESYVRIVLTRGAGAIGLDPALAVAEKRIIIVQPLALPPPELYARGARVALVSVLRNPRQALDPAVKSGNYLNNIMGLAEARKLGADECLMCNVAGRVVEGSSSNVFVVRGGRLATPALAGGLLDGITRRRVIELARGEGLTALEVELSPEDVLGADEVFITSSIRGVLPVATVNGRAIGAGAPGPVSARLVRRYEEFLAEVARGL